MGRLPELQIALDSREGDLDMTSSRPHRSLSRKLAAEESEDPRHADSAVDGGLG
jgi:hypothetical protein